MVGLCLGTHVMMCDQEPMMRRLEAIKHLVAVRLTEESERRRQEQQFAASLIMSRHNRITRWIAVVGIMIAAFSALANWFPLFWSANKPAISEIRAVAPLPITNNTPIHVH
jgi:hypothetical protein